jgi:hypothetical protein
MPAARPCFSDRLRPLAGRGARRAVAHGRVRRLLLRPPRRRCGCTPSPPQGRCPPISPLRISQVEMQ